MSDTNNEEVKSNGVAQTAGEPGNNVSNGTTPATAPANPAVDQLHAGLTNLVAGSGDEETRHPVHVLAQSLANMKQAPVLTFWLDDSIDRTDAEAVHTVLEAALPEEIEHLWVVLASSGGSLDAAYQIGRLLQARAKKISAVIPRWAKSAATLLSLGCDEVVMHPLAELGPLDAQVETKRDGEVLFISTLDVVRANDYIRTYAVDTFDKLMALISTRSPATYEAGVAMSANVLAPLIAPMFAKLDPVQLGEFDRALSLATEYGRRLMRRPYRTVPENVRNAMLTKLVKGYAAHSFVIDLEEASSLGLHVRPPDQEERSLMNACATHFSECKLHHHDEIDLHLPKKKDDPIRLAPGAAQA